jgi:excisionase family DNA binding protein
MSDEVLPIRLCVNPACPGWLTVPEGSEYTGIPESTFRKMISRGEIPVWKRPGAKPKSHMLVWSGDLDALMRAGHRPATSGPLAGEA